MNRTTQAKKWWQENGEKTRQTVTQLASRQTQSDFSSGARKVPPKFVPSSNTCSPCQLDTNLVRTRAHGRISPDQQQIAHLSRR
jgi:hypothetical protein